MMAKKEKLQNINKIISELNSARKALLNLRFQRATGQLEKTSQVKKTRKKIVQLINKINQNKEAQDA